MKKIIFVLFVVCLFSVPTQSAELMLPFSGGQTWSCDQGNYNDPGNIYGYYCYFDEDGDGDIDGTTGSNMDCVVGAPDRKWQESNPTHRTDSKLKDSWDFNMGANSDLGLPVLAPASGKIVYARNSNSGWGNTVIIDYGDGTFGKLAHLNEIFVSEGQDVSQGKPIGTCGGTPYWSPHIHYQTQEDKDINARSLSSSFIDTEEPDKVPKEGGLYTSLNTYNPYNNFKVGKFSDGWRIEPWGTSFNYTFTPFSRPFVITYFHEGGLNTLGHPANTVHQASSIEIPGYNQYVGISLPYIQDIQNTSGGYPWLTLVLNPYVFNIRMNYFGVVYPVQGRIRDYWKAYYSQLGYPVSNEYFEIVNNKNYAVQWFEKSDNNFVKVTYNVNEGSFNDPETDFLSYGDHLNQSTWRNLGCPNGGCGVGGDGGNTSPEPDPTEVIGAEFGEAKICDDVENGGDWKCVDEKYVFYNTNQEIYSWIEILNLYEAVNLKWVWYYPNKNIALEYDKDTASPPEGGYIGWWRHNCGLNLTNDNNYGTWEIKFYINNILTNTSYFELRKKEETLIPPILRIQ